MWSRGRETPKDPQANNFLGVIRGGGKAKAGSTAAGSGASAVRQSRVDATAEEAGQAEPETSPPLVPVAPAQGLGEHGRAPRSHVKGGWVSTAGTAEAEAATEAKTGVTLGSK